MPSSPRILTLPNLLTLLRLAFIPLILYLLWVDRVKWALILFVAAGVSDLLDGRLARWLGQKTLVGMYMDPIADKLLLSSSFLMLAITGQMPWLVTGVVLGRDLAIMVAVVVLVLATELREFAPSFLGKVNTAVQLVAVYAVLLDAVYGFGWLHLAREGLLVLTPVVAVANGIQYGYLTLRKLRRPRPAPATSR
jgi:cardiolipin synthase